MGTSRRVHWWLYFLFIEKFVGVTTPQTLLVSIKLVYKHYNAKLRSDVSFSDSTSELGTSNWTNWWLLQKFVIDESSTFATTDRGIIRQNFSFFDFQSTRSFNWDFVAEIVLKLLNWDVWENKVPSMRLKTIHRQKFRDSERNCGPACNGNFESGTQARHN